MESPHTQQHSAVATGSGKECPKCHYVRQADDLAPEWECPACKIVYAKFARGLAQIATTPRSEQHASRKGQWKIWQRLTLLSSLLLITIAVAIHHFRPVTAADFRLPDLTGKTLRLRDQYGKVVLLNFWATWCAACLSELPALQQLSQVLQSQPFALWTVNLREQPASVARFMETYRLQFPVLLDRDGAVSAEYGVQQLPTSFLIDCGGKIAGTIVGVWDAEANQTLFTLLQQAKHDERCLRPGMMRL